MTCLFPSLLKDTCVAGALYHWLLVYITYITIYNYNYNYI